MFENEKCLSLCVCFAVGIGVCSSLFPLSHWHPFAGIDPTAIEVHQNSLKPFVDAVLVHMTGVCCA